ncbi:hypothetical protein [Sphingorhabdus lacus]|nr:hypothetical protein [Sphingorhabdus lacus]
MTTAGTIEEGKLVDLVLLDADPMADINITTTIDTAICVTDNRVVTD